MSSRYVLTIGAGIAAITLSVAPSVAAETAFTYKTSYRNVTADPEHIWTGTALAPNPRGTVTIHEYGCARRKATG